MRNGHLLQIIYKPHISEKISAIIKHNNTFAIRVIKNATKTKIKSAVEKLFAVEVKDVNTLIVKGKIKRHGKCISRRKYWKKAYIVLKKGQKINLVDNFK